MKLGYKVIIITRAFNNRIGIRYLQGGIKVYYLPLQPLVIKTIIAPSFFNSFALMRQILIREQVDIYHGHQATSTLQIETIF